MLIPLVCVRFNGFMIKLFNNCRPEKAEPIHKYLPERDLKSIGIALLATVFFTFWLSGLLCEYSHLVCKQTELTLKFFQSTSCEHEEIFNQYDMVINQEWPFLHEKSTIDASGTPVKGY